MADFDCIEPGIVVDVVAVIQIDRLLDGAHVDAGQAADGFGKVAVGARIVGGPVGAAFFPIVRNRLRLP